MSYFVYILKSELCGRFYIGQTKDLNRRLIKHNSGQVKSTKAYLPWKLVYTEQFNNRSDAMKREVFLKKQKNTSFYLKLINNAQN